MKISTEIKKLITNIRLNRAIRQAEKYKRITRYNFLVLLYNGKPLVFSRTRVKELIKAKVLKAKINKIEKAALYKTY